MTHSVPKRRASDLQGRSRAVGRDYRGQMSIQITSAFDGGNIRVLSITDDTAELEIETDHQSDFYQWFYFRVAGGDAATMRITNAGGSAYPGGWPGYKEIGRAHV